jgi:MFS family permease
MLSREKLLIQKNFAKLYAYSFFQSFLIIIPIIVPFWQKKGLSLHEIFMLQGVFGMTLIICDAPAGYFADLFGRKRSMVIGSFISAVGFQILWFGQTFMHFAIYEMVLGLGLSLQSGCDVAILYHSLDKLEINGKKTSFLGKRIFFLTFGEGIASLIGGFLAGFSLELPAYANALTGWLPMLFALMIYEPSGDLLSSRSHLKNFKDIGRAIFGHSRLLSLVILSFILYGFATYCAVWSLQPYWKERGLSYSIFGYLWAANSFFVAVISRYAHRIEEKIGTTQVVIIIGCMPIIGYLGMGYVGGLFGLIFTLAFPVCRGLNQVIFQDAINSRVPSEMRATVNSFGTLGMRALFIGFGPLIGSALDHHGPDHAMKVLGAIYVVIFILITLPLLRQKQDFR